MTQIAQELNKVEGGLEAFIKLLSVNENDIKYYVAFDLLNFIHPAADIETKCLSLIKNKIKEENHLGYKYWLEDWEKNRNKS